jgi:hypothetical protein
MLLGLGVLALLPIFVKKIFGSKFKTELNEETKKE